MEELKLLIKEAKNEEFKNRNINVYKYLDIHGENLLHWACAFNNAEICEYLIVEKKLHINLENFRGTTPLYYAAMKNSKEAINVMLKYNANPRIRSGFSGQFPSEVTTNPEIETSLKQAEENIPIYKYESVCVVRNNVSLYKSYKYRKYMAYLTNLNYFNNTLPEEVKQRFYGGIVIFEKLHTIFKEQGIEKLASYVQSIYDDYLNTIPNYEGKICLNCNKDATKKCSKCQKVYFCDRTCQTECHLFHKYDCK